MDLFNLIFIIIMIIGFITIILSITKINKYNNKTPISDVDSSIKQMKETIDKADLAIDDLNLLSEEIFKRFDEKQKQILFLYDAIENKKNTDNKIDIKVDEKVNTKHNKKYNNIENDVKVDVKKEVKKNKIKNPLANRIQELLDKGMSISDIAKSLNMGQGEVELIINLGKDN